MRCLTWLPSIFLLPLTPSTAQWPDVGGKTCVAKFVTPAAVAAARAFTGCPTLNGIEIEGEDTTPCAPQGSHLEQTRWNTGLMCPYAQHRREWGARGRAAVFSFRALVKPLSMYSPIHPRTFLTPLTRYRLAAVYVTPIELAVFEDSGWYSPNYAAADDSRAGLSWAAGMGCDFALGKCIKPDGTPSSPRHYFTTDRDTSSGNAVCTVDRKAIGYADVSDTANPPQPFAYWPAQPGKGGSLPSVFDFCPAVQAYSNSECGHGNWWGFRSGRSDATRELYKRR